MAAQKVERGPIDFFK